MSPLLGMLHKVLRCTPGLIAAPTKPRETLVLRWNARSAAGQRLLHVFLFLLKEFSAQSPSQCSVCVLRQQLYPKRRCSGGMPDLLLWNVNTCKAKLSEVKGPRDRLSEQQRAWINALIDAEVDVEVLKVVEPRVGKAPKRRRKW